MELNSFVVHTLHRGRLIQILLGSLFVIGVLVSNLQIDEIVKILALLVCLPLVLYCSVRFSQQPSTWTISPEHLQVSKGSKTFTFPLKDIIYIKNHLRSGGNLVAIYYQHKKQPMRFWRNKLFQSMDDFEALMHRLKECGVVIQIG